MCNMACNKFVCATLPERDKDREREREGGKECAPNRAKTHQLWRFNAPRRACDFLKSFHPETTNKLKGTLIATVEPRKEWWLGGGTTVNCRLLKYAKLTRHNYNTQNADKHA